MMGSSLVIILVFTIFARLGNSQPAATIVYGQGGSFTSSTENNGGISAGSLSTPNGLAIDGTNGLYVADTQNSRVVYYLSGSTVATRVYGQTSFTTNTANNGGITANSLSVPNDVAVDSSNNLYISDTGNNRVLLYSAGSTTAVRVYGQANSFGTNTANKGGISANSLSGPGGIVFDSRDRLYVADTNNNRVLAYFPGSITASVVYGQGGSFSSTGSTPVTANSLFLPTKVYLDSVFNVYIVDSRNSRVLSYPFNDPNPTTATAVYGQAGSFTTGACCNPGGVSAMTLSTPSGVTSDISGNLYIGDTINNRILVYASGATTANKVYGQANSLTTAGQGVSVNALNMPTFVAVSTFNGGGLYVSDTGNNRIVYYPDPAAGTTTTTTSSSTTSPANSSSTTCFHESTVITYKGKEYNMKNLNTAYTGNECHIPHIVRANGLAIYIGTLFGKHLRVTADHLIYTAPHGDLVAASTLMVGDRMYLSLDQRVTGIISKIFEERDQTYFGLNCLESIVLANGVKASTFGKQHEIPAKWMSIVGGIFGVERASRWGDKLANLFVKIGAI